MESGTTRARRFPIVVPLRYRPTDEIGWSQGETENISWSGVLFRTERPLTLLTEIEMTFVLPAVLAGPAGVVIVSRCQVVRAEASRPPDSRAVVAARILEYRFVRGQEPEEPS